MKGSFKVPHTIVCWLNSLDFAHALSFYSFHIGTPDDKLGLTMLDDVNGYIGWWQPAIVGIVAMVVVGMVAERWFAEQ